MQRSFSALFLLLAIFVSAMVGADAYLPPARGAAAARAAARRASQAPGETPAAKAANREVVQDAPGADRPRRRQRSQKRHVDVLRLRETNGGWSADLKATIFSSTSTHTVILARSIHEELCKRSGVDASPTDVMKAVLFAMVNMGMKLENTEGMIDASQFPQNYFSVRQLLYFFPSAYDAIADVIRGADDE